MAIEEAKDAKARAEELVTSLEAKVALATAAAEAREALVVVTACSLVVDAPAARASTLSNGS